MKTKTGDKSPQRIGVLPKEDIKFTSIQFHKSVDELNLCNVSHPFCMILCVSCCVHHSFTTQPCFKRILVSHNDPTDIDS